MAGRVLNWSFALGLVAGLAVMRLLYGFGPIVLYPVHVSITTTGQVKEAKAGIFGSEMRSLIPVDETTHQPIDDDLHSVLVNREGGK